MKKTNIILALALAFIILPVSYSYASSLYAERDMGVNNLPKPNYDVEPFWLSMGEHVLYPNEGGVWQYGFWNAKVRSYYTVAHCHGSTVVLNENYVRSVDTAPGYTSVAEKWALNYWGNDDEYYYRLCD